MNTGLEPNRTFLFLSNPSRMFLSERSLSCRYPPISELGRHGYPDGLAFLSEMSCAAVHHGLAWWKHPSLLLCIVLYVFLHSGVYSLVSGIIVLVQSSRTAQCIYARWSLTLKPGNAVTLNQNIDTQRNINLLAKNIPHVVLTPLLG